VLWIYASSAARLEQSVRANLDDLKVRGRADQAAEAFRLLRSWLQDSKNGRWLVILDNVDTAQFLLEPPSSCKKGICTTHQAPSRERILDYFPASCHGSILITSRTTDAALKVVERTSVIAVEPMGVEYAVELLDKKLGCKHTHEEALDLAKALDCIPLAISQAAAYISQEWPRCTVQQYLKKLVESDMDKSNLLYLDDGDLRRDKEATNSIITTWQISFERIRATRFSAANLLSLMSFFDRQSIPQAILRRRETSGQSRGEKRGRSHHDFDLDIKLLRSYAFISAVNADTFTMHSRVQFAMRKWLQARSLECLWKEHFINVLDRTFSEACGYEDWSTCEALYPHIKAAQSLKPPDRIVSKIWAELLYNCAFYAWNRGLRADAHLMAKLSTDEFVRLEGQESSLAFRGMAYLAEITAKDPSLPITSNLQEELVEISKKIYGDDSIMTAECAGMLAESYRRQGRLQDAANVQLEVVAILRRLLGDEDPATLSRTSDLAAIYGSQKLCEKAADLDEYVLGVRKRIFGPQHLTTTTCMATLALTYLRMGLYGKASVLGTEAFKIQRETLGSEHPNTLSNMANLAMTLWKQGSEDEAISLSAQALEMRRKALGSDHSDTLNTMHDLVSMYYTQKSYDKAIELGSESYETSERVLGPGHEYTLARMATFARSLHAVGRRQSASNLMDICAARTCELGPGDPQTVRRQQRAERWRKGLVSVQLEDIRDNANAEACDLMDEGF
jgi:tetratricopeptide (TPR) repeat protein